MKRRDYISSNNEQFDIFFKNVLGHVNGKTSKSKPEWTHIPKNAVTDLEASYGEWEKVYRKTIVPHTSQETRERDRVRRSSEKTLRSFVNDYLRGRDVSDKERDDMGVRNRKSRSPIGAPTNMVTGSVILPGTGIVEISDIRTMAGSAGDIRSDIVVRIQYGILGNGRGTDKFRLTEIPSTGDDLPHSVFIRKRNHRFDFSGESGNTVYFSLRYENGKAEYGPWSPVFIVVIP